jgi:DNA-binding NtrC family response regulator
MAAPRGVPAFRPDQFWQQAREPLFWLDSLCRLSWVNRAWEDLTGQSGGSLLGLSCAAHGPSGTDVENELAHCFSPPSEVMQGAPAGNHALIPRGAGAPYRCRVEFWPFRDREGTLLGILGQVRDPDDASVPDSKIRQLQARLQELREQLRGRFGFDALIGTGPAHDRLLEQIRLAAAEPVPVLIVGEPGTGKRLVGQIIHDSGPSRPAPILPLDCEALPAEVIEQELRKLASTAAPDEDAPARQPRLSVPALTLLVGDLLALPRDQQCRLFEVLTTRPDVRLVAMTAGDPEAAVREERLRPDLYHAITTLVLRIEPLRQRRQDVAILAEHLLGRINRRKGVVCGGLDPQAISALESYHWPGNVRELERVLAMAHGLVTGRRDGANPALTIGPGDLPASIRGHLGGAYLAPVDRFVKPLDELLTEIERRLIETALGRARQNKSRAAELLGISRPRLYRRIKELNLPEEGEPDPEPGPAPITTST